MRRLSFVTGNKGKLEEARARLAHVGVEVVPLDLAPVEIQADALAEVARAKADSVAARHDGPFLIDDAGLFVDALRGFPGVYSAYALKTIGTGGILRLLDGVPDRAARFECHVVYRDAAGASHAFRGECSGRIAHEARAGGHGFGFDPIFVPEGDSRTFAEIPVEEKNRVSHRGRALDALVAHLARESR